jgi:hypothetical protein
MSRDVKVHEWLRLSNYSAIWVGDDGQFYQVFELPGNLPMKGRPPCQTVCGHELHRIHLSCLRCRARRVLRGDLPPTFPVGVYYLVWRKGRRFEAVKAAILKRLLSVAEFLSD